MDFLKVLSEFCQTLKNPYFCTSIFWPEHISGKNLINYFTAVLFFKNFHWVYYQWKTNFSVHFSLTFRLLFFMLAVLFLQEKLRIAFSFNGCMIQSDLKLLWHLYPVRFGELILQAICLQLTLESQWFPGISAWNIAHWPKISVLKWQCYQPVFHFHSLEPLHGILVC